MSRFLSCFVVLVALLGAACKSGRKAPRPEAPLERAVHFVERDTNDELHPISEISMPAKDAAPTVERIPRGDLVDFESSVDISILRDELLSSERRAALPANLERVAQRAKDLRALLDRVAPYVEARATLVRSFDLDLETYEAALEVYREAEAPILGLFHSSDAESKPLFPDDDEHAELRDAVEAFLAGEKDADRELTRLLQADIDELDRAARRSVEAARENGTRLRIEAFLVPAGSEQPTALPLPGYNNISSREVDSIDRFGLALSPSDAERLRSLLRESRKLSDTLNRVKRGTTSLDEALRDSSSIVARELGALVTEVRTLAANLEAEALRKRVDATRAAIDEFLAAARAELAASFGEALEREKRTLLSSIAELEARSQALAELVKILELVPQVRDAWTDASVEDLDVAIAKSVELIGSIAATAKEPQAVLSSVADAMRALEVRARAWPDEADATVRRAIADVYAASKLATEVDQWRDLAARTRRTVDRIARVLPFEREKEWKPVDLAVRAPATRDVPLEDASGTAITLKGSGAGPGDSIEVRTTLLDGTNEPAHGHATFEVAKLGWHADLHPAVVLITADQIAGRADDGGFSASLAWMLHHTPRRHEDGFWSEVSRATQWGVGLHAALLNFDPDNDAEIGLGVTLGLWGEKLLLGAGYNIAADADDEGRYYYYVGSSLIALLQSLQAD